MLEENKQYTVKELAQALGVSYDNFRKQKDKFISNLGRYYDYSVDRTTKGDIYTIIRKRAEYQAPMKNKERENIRYDVFANVITDVIKNNPIQTATSVASIIKDNERVKEYGLTTRSLEEYTRRFMKQLFGTEIIEGGTRGRISHKVKCKKEGNTYVPMTEWERSSYMALKDIAEASINENIEIMEKLYNEGKISEQGKNEVIQNHRARAWNQMYKDFLEIWEYIPMSIPFYELYAFDWETGEVILEEEVC